MDKAVRDVLSTLVHGRGEMSYISCIITADRGYGKSLFADIFRGFVMSVLLIAPENVRCAHPFLASSTLKASTEPEDDSNNDDCA